MVASGNKRARMVVAGVETKAGSSSKRWGLCGNAGDTDHRHQVCPTWVYGLMRYDNQEARDIPKWYITKMAPEPTIYSHGSLMWQNFRPKGPKCLMLRLYRTEQWS